MEKGLVSIIIPMYNASKYIGEMIESILNQTYKFWELWIVDDASTDYSVDRVNSYVNSDNRINIISSIENCQHGAAFCRNEGLKRAKGEYIMWLDADDIIADYCVEQRVAYMQSNLNVDFAVFPMVAFKSVPFDAPRNLVWGYKCDNVLSDLISGDPLPFVVVTNIYRSESLFKHNVSWDVNLSSYQDRDFNINAILSGLNFSVTNLKPDYFYRIAIDDSICSKINTSKHFKSRNYYINKLSGSDLLVGMYRKELMILTSSLFGILLKDSNYDHLKLFLSLPVFNKKLLLKLKLKILYWLHIRFNTISEFKKFILKMMLCPIFEYRRYNHLKKGISRNNILYQELKTLYKASVLSSLNSLKY